MKHVTQRFAFRVKAILLKRRDALRSALAGDLSLLKELRGQTSGDVVDAALDSAQDEISSQLAEVESRELARIENALEQIAHGKYGVCEGCSCKIPMARLMHCRTLRCASNANVKPKRTAIISVAMRTLAVCSMVAIAMSALTTSKSMRLKNRSII